MYGNTKSKFHRVNMPDQKPQDQSENNLNKLKNKHLWARMPREAGGLCCDKVYDLLPEMSPGMGWVR